MCKPIEMIEASERGAFANASTGWFDELTDLENRTADAVMRLKVVRSALEGILPDLVHRSEYDMISGCIEIVGESVGMLEG